MKKSFQVILFILSINIGVLAMVISSCNSAASGSPAGTAAPTQSISPTGTLSSNPSPTPTSTTFVTPTPAPSPTATYTIINPTPWGAPAVSYTNGDTDVENWNPGSIMNGAEGMEVKLTGAFNPVYLVSYLSNTSNGNNGNMLMGLYSDCGTNAPANLIAETAPFCPGVDNAWYFVPFTNVSGLKLAAGNYWIFIEGQFTVNIYNGNTLNGGSTCASYYGGLTGYGCNIGGYYDYIHNLMPTNFSWCGQGGRNFSIYMISSNN